MSPEIPGPWPGPDYAAGANGSGNDGFEIDRRGVRAVSGKLIQLAHDEGDDSAIITHTRLRMGFPWEFPNDLARCLHGAGLSVRIFRSDLHAEIGTAGVLIERACTRYDLVDNPRLGDMPFLEAGSEGVRPPDRLGERPSIHFGGPSRLYPNGSEPLPLVVDDGVERVTAEMAVTSFYQPSTGDGIPTYLEQMISSLVEVANTLPLRAQDLHDAPWSGEAADLTQRALRQIYENVIYLATWADTLNAACRRFLEVVDWYVTNFHEMVDPNRRYWDELLDLGSTADSRTRSFLRAANLQFLEVLNMIPQPFTENLPGLMVVDEDLEWTRHEVRWHQKYDSAALNRLSGQMQFEELQRRLEAQEAAERTYG
ncbi:hypothetical protein [Nonomuraea basaltis]|uniref:hypothetical protein n=1 Tax=Nonomuraea basaltis TaxID=2495887 RepID=UPI00110C5567|nr:hypothetical protein [Nonomuraea basaltis]